MVWKDGRGGGGVVWACHSRKGFRSNEWCYFHVKTNFVPVVNNKCQCLVVTVQRIEVDLDFRSDVDLGSVVIETSLLIVLVYAFYLPPSADIPLYVRLNPYSS